MKLGDTINLADESERQKASKAANFARRAGLIDFVFKTRMEDGKFIGEAT